MPDWESVLISSMFVTIERTSAQTRAAKDSYNASRARRRPRHRMRRQNSSDDVVLDV